MPVLFSYAYMRAQQVVELDSTLRERWVYESDTSVEDSAIPISTPRCRSSESSPVKKTINPPLTAMQLLQQPHQQREQGSHFHHYHHHHQQQQQQHDQLHLAHVVESFAQTGGTSPRRPQSVVTAVAKAGTGGAGETIACRVNARTSDSS